MKQWEHDLIHLASTMPDNPDPGFNETLNFLRLVHNGKWDQLSFLDWSVLDNQTIFSLAVNVLKPEALLSTPFDWITAQRGTSPVVHLLTAKTLYPFMAKDNDSNPARATYISQKFWESPMVQEAFPFNTQVVVDNTVMSLGDLALQWNAPSAEHFLKRTWNSEQEKTKTWTALFKMIASAPLPSFTNRSPHSVFERADAMFDLMPKNNPFGTPADISLLQLALKTLMKVADHKLEEQSLNRKLYDQKPMAIEMEEFTLRICEFISETLNNDPSLWYKIFDEASVERNPLAMRVVVGMVFQGLDDFHRHTAVDALVNKVTEDQCVMWAKVIPTHPSIALPLSDKQIASIIGVCSDYYTINWVCTTLSSLATSDTQDKLKNIQLLNEKTKERNLSSQEKERITLEMTSLISSFGNNQAAKARKM